jgi:hypothetical protein
MNRTHGAVPDPAFAANRADIVDIGLTMCSICENTPSRGASRSERTVSIDILLLVTESCRVPAAKILVARLHIDLGRACTALCCPAE